MRLIPTYKGREGGMLRRVLSSSLVMRESCREEGLPTSLGKRESCWEEGLPASLGRRKNVKRRLRA